MKFYLFFVSIYFVFINAVPINLQNEGEQLTCGYKSCPTINSDSTVLNVHIVPHSHDDVGWLKTVDQYYYGSKNNIQKAGVQYILTSVIEALLQNPKRRFIYVETAFFWKWWQEQSDEVRKQVQFLVNNGQLEITGGAWSMNDEAAAHYLSTIDQFTWGFRKLNETLGTCAQPKIAWQIDPFGHSREMASLFAQFGFDGLFFARLDWRDKNLRLITKTAEMLWKGSPSLGSSSDLFTSVLYNHYSAPSGFCFDVLCTDAPIVDDKNSPEYNAEERAIRFVNFVRTQATYYKTNNVIITMGDDFNYQDALSYFKNLDKLIKSVNDLKVNVTAFYSSPSCYVKEVNAVIKDLPIKTDDFFPYASDPHTYWNGYFTSRPTSKRFERFGNNFLQIAKQLSALTIPQSSESGLDPMREAIGIMQHHDAITGTEKQHVADDYARILYSAFEETEKVAQEKLRKLYQAEDITFNTCLQLNISKCEFTENKKKFHITVYNPLSQTTSQYIRIPITDQSYNVYLNGELIQSQIIPIFEGILKIPGRESSATHELVFRAENLPPLGFKSYEVKVSSSEKSNSIDKILEREIKLNFNHFGFLKSLTVNNESIQVYQNYYYYPAAVGNNAEFKNRSSGAYIFRPDPKTKDAIPITEKIQTKTYEGPLVTEYHQKFSEWVGQVIRVYANEKHVEFNWVVGPIPVNDEIGKEIISRFSTKIQSKGVFFTDSNGREIIERVRDHRNTFNLTHEEPIAENYYPVTSKIVLKDASAKNRIAVLNDRAQGGSSLNDGEIELMVHRRLLRDDAFGVGEALNENAFGTGLVAVGKHLLVIELNEGISSVALEKTLASRMLLEPWIFISPDNNKISKSEFSGLKQFLPVNLQIITLEPWDKNTILLRLEHVYEKDEDPVLSSPVTIDLKDLFTTFQIKEIKEMSLGANHLKSTIKRLQWKSQEIPIDSTKNTLINLNAMEIKTFILKIEPRSN